MREPLYLLEAVREKERERKGTLTPPVVDAATDWAHSSLLGVGAQQVAQAYHGVQLY